jgi:uncharacterized protein YbaR (Trm112 family)
VTYKIPFCRACKTELMVVEQFTHEYLRSIRPSGRVGKPEKQYTHFEVNKRLKCSACGRIYQMHIDQDHRVARGRQIARSKSAARQ